MPRRQSQSVRRGAPLALSVNGREVTAFAGESVATVLLAEGITAFNKTRNGRPRGPFCNMGTCYECQVLIAGPGSSTFVWHRACLQVVQGDMQVKTGVPVSDSPADHHAD